MSKEAAHFVDSDVTGEASGVDDWSSTRNRSAAEYTNIIVGHGTAGTMLLNSDFQQVKQTKNPPHTVTYHVHQDINGLFYSGSGPDGSDDNKPYKLDADFDIVSGWPSETTWPTGITGYCFSARPTENAQFVYAVNRSGTNFQIAKLNASDGSLVWRVQRDLRPNPWDIGIRSNNDVIVGNWDRDGFGNDYPAILSSEDGSVLSTYKGSPDNQRGVSAHYRILVVESIGLWFTCGIALTGALNSRGIVQAFNLGSDLLLTRAWDFSDTAISGHVGRGIIYKDGFIYVVGNRVLFNGTNKCLWKLNATTGALVASLDLGFTLQDILIDSQKRIVVVQNNATTNLWTILNDNLSIISQHDRDDDPVSSWQVWRAEGVPDPVLWGLTTPTTTHQERTTAFPQDLTHLNGQTVQLLQDGLVTPDQVVTGGTVTTTGAINHVGLKYISKLQPMKI